MITYQLQHIAEIIQAGTKIAADIAIEDLLTDSRKLVFPQRTLFFAIGGPRRDGHQFIPELYERGVRCFVVRSDYDAGDMRDGFFLNVADVLQALQKLAAYHRQQFNIPVIGITGSNGKTIVKEWLYQLLHMDQHIVRSPRSYNSQIGVPLSVWQMQPQHTLAIFEAGISTVHEMEKLEPVIRATMGIFTNIGEAHREGFENDREKALEKAKLFAHAQQLIFCREALAPSLYPDGADRTLFNEHCDFFTWSRVWDATVFIEKEERTAGSTIVHAVYQQQAISITIPFTDRISVDNAITCWCVMLAMQYDEADISQRMQQLEPVEMRMQLKKAVNNCYLVNDSYSNDVSSLYLALDYLKQQAGENHTTVIISDIFQSGQTEETLYGEIAAQLSLHGIDRLIGIGAAISKHSHLFTLPEHLATGQKSSFFDSTESFLQQVNTNQFKDEYILLKGARLFAFERISHLLEQQIHQTVMEINLTAMAHNLKAYQEHLEPATKLMAMVKAFSYGSGSAEVARVLQFHKIDYLAVAYADEGVELRKAGISLPIMVMNADEATFDSLVTYDLEPEIYSFHIYHAFQHYLNSQGIVQFPIHIKFNTGMNRLGFEAGEAKAICVLLKEHRSMVVKSVFSHLAASDDPGLDDFTHRQAGLLIQACTVMQQQLGYDFIRHISNTAAILRYPNYQFDMVRLGIGLYGVDNTNAEKLALQTVATLRTTIAQLRRLEKGQTVGYNRKGVVHADSLIATIRIGYADGFSRRLGNGVGQVYVRGRRAPVIGNVCMDMVMVDVTGIPGVKEGDEVELFGKHIAVQEVAKWEGTIAYEVMTGISQRVKRIYIEE